MKRALAFSGVAATLLLIACSGGAVGGSSVRPSTDAGVNPDASALGNDAGTWSLNGTLGGISLQSIVRSSGAHIDDSDASALRTVVGLSTADGYCGQLHDSCAEGGLAQRAIFVSVPGTTPGTFAIADAGAAVLIYHLGNTCEELSPTVKATSGTVRLIKADLEAGGEVTMSLDIATPDGPLSGTITAPSCK